MRILKSKRFVASGAPVIIDLLDPDDANNNEWLGPWAKTLPALGHNTKVAITAVNTGSALAWIGTLADVADYIADPDNGPIFQIPSGGSLSPVAGAISTDGITVRKGGDLVLYLEDGADVVISPAVSW